MIIKIQEYWYGNLKIWDIRRHQYYQVYVEHPELMEKFRTGTLKGLLLAHAFKNEKNGLTCTTHIIRRALST